MQCVPMAKGKTHFPCRGCLPCRVNAARRKQARILLELGEHDAASFITLTYTREGRPTTSKGRWTLSPTHIDEWTKKFRRNHGPFRYWIVGEYGEPGTKPDGTVKEEHPHYHCILFGVSRETAMQWDHLWTGVPGNGFIDYGHSVNAKVAAYVSAYATKKLRAGHPALDGRHPEFTRSSRGIGLKTADRIAKYLTGPTLSKVRLENGDMPIQNIRFEGKLYALDPYLKKKIREKANIKVVHDNYDLLAASRADLDPQAAEYHETRLYRRLRTAEAMAHETAPGPRIYEGPAKPLVPDSDTQATGARQR